MEGKAFFGTTATVESLVDRCKLEDATERWAAVIELGELGTVEAARALRGCLEDPDEFVREATRAAIKKMSKEVLVTAGLPTEPTGRPQLRVYQTGKVRFETHLQAPPFSPWRIRRLPEPGKSEPRLVDAAIVDIVGTEGPIRGHRLLNLYGRAVWPDQPSKLSQAKVQAVVERVIERGLISRSDDFTSEYLSGWILHRTGSLPVLVRQRGARDLSDIPVNEVHEVLLELSQSIDGKLRIDSNRAFQLIFDFYKIEQRDWHVVGKLLTEEWAPLLKVR